MLHKCIGLTILLLLGQKSMMETTKPADDILEDPWVERDLSNSSLAYKTTTETLTEQLVNKSLTTSSSLGNSTEIVTNASENHHQMVKKSSTHGDPNECLTTRYLHTATSAGFTIFGLCGNLISIRILYKIRTKNSSSFLLSVLAVWDSVLLLTRLILSISSVFGYSKKYPIVQFVLLAVLVYGYPFNELIQSQSTYVIVLVTVHRFIAVCYPHATKRYCNLEIAKKQVIIITFLAVLISIPLFLMEQVVPKTNEFNSTTYLIEYTNLGKYEIFMLVYPGIIFMILVFLAPLVGLLVLVIYLIRAVKTANQNRINSLGKTAVLQDVTKMLVPVVIIFMFCQIWTRVVRFAWFAQVKTIKFFSDTHPF